MTKQERIEYILKSALIIAALIFAYFACTYIELNNANDYGDRPIRPLTKLCEHTGHTKDEWECRYVS